MSCNRFGRNTLCISVDYVSPQQHRHSFFQTKEKILRKQFFRMEILVKQIPSETFANKKEFKKIRSTVRRGKGTEINEYIACFEENICVSL